jgi:hypothetical protein
MPNANELPLNILTLQEFCTNCFRLVEDNKFAEFIQFALTGMDRFYQAVIDVHQNALNANTVPLLRATRDYDSALGISPQIIPSTNIAIYILPNFKESLSKNIHIKYEFTNDNVGFIFFL